MRAETYLNAYFAVRDRLEFVRLNGRTRARLVRQERKLEARLRDQVLKQTVLSQILLRQYDEVWKRYKECHKERVFLWAVVIFQLAFLVGLAMDKVLF